jgi:hypothetical protein
MMMSAMTGLVEDGELHVRQEAGMFSYWLMRPRMLCPRSALRDTLPVEVWVPIEDRQGRLLPNSRSVRVLNKHQPTILVGGARHAGKPSQHQLIFQTV